MKYLLILPLTVFLTACAGITLTPSASDLQKSWDKRQSALANLHIWKLTGRISINNSEDAWHAVISWRQTPGHYAINITSPFGGASVRLNGSPSGVVMRTSEGQVYTAGNAETLLRSRLGWQVPVDGLRYWVTGLPTPGNASDRTLDENGRLSELSQSGWNITFLRYLKVGDMDLPDKIYLTNEQLEVKLVVDKWSLGT